MASRRKAVAREAPTWITPGLVVDYHSLIRPLGPVTQAGLVVREGPYDLHGQWVVWLHGKAGCVSVEAITLASPASRASDAHPPADEGGRT